ncbi:54S ribosomal protein L6 mitochondrial [Ascochyta rabiei]|uniref:rRNA binding n=1 Tax=Didymella rabiei TaxID=5454 RepID=A0A163M7P3_DIDRA|nr:54S ribosomal protein L6 mitochondrial [Ascochyta rabiei]KZM28469.1 rRNA binding [Ascochyta rabiei]UPX15567.1 54S ribosomal protein L6 mitochondrial [Ascochyta rabiei]
MFAPARRRCAQAIAQSTSPAADSIPTFLLPRFAAPRTFTTTAQCGSKIGALPLSVPPGVTFSVIAPKAAAKGARTQSTNMVHVKGPLGELSMEIAPYIAIDQQSMTLSIQDATDAKQKAMWGTTRAYLQNHILGVSEGHSAILRFVGVGFRASIEDTATTVEAEFPGQKFVNLKVGYSHPVELCIPKGVTASTPQPTRLLLEGPEKEVVMQFAAKIRKWRVPEPYKGKGIFVNGETIKLKNKKVS